MATASNWREGLQKQFLECSICLGPFKNPRCLPCLHVCCIDCIKGLIKGNQGDIKCPYCEADTPIPDKGAEGFPIAFHINALQDFVKHQDPKRAPIHCFNKKNNPQHSDATVKCLDCNVYYCDNCNNGHKMAAFAENHETILVSNLRQEHFEKAAQKQVTYCQQHPTSPMNFYCKDEGCQIPVCQRCCIITHSQHEVVDLDEISNQCRDETNKILKKITGVKSSHRSSKWEYVRQKQMANQLFERNKKAIEDRFQETLKKLEQSKENLLKEAEARVNSFIGKWDAKIIIIDEEISRLEVTEAAATNMTNFSSDYAIVKQHKELLENVKQSLQDTADFRIFPPQLKGGVVSVGDPVVYMNMNAEEVTYYIGSTNSNFCCEMCRLLDKVNKLASSQPGYY